MTSVSDTIQYATVAQYLAQDEILKNAYYKAGGVTQRDLPKIIYEVRKTVEWCYNNNPDDVNLTTTANYLYALCGKFLTEAQGIIGAGGGVIINPVVIAALVRINFIVGTPGYPQNGDATYQSNSLIGLTNISVYREGDLQFEGAPGTGYTYNNNTGEITFYPVLHTNERISIRGW